jgi:protein-disulfide isomerase
VKTNPESSSDDKIPSFFVNHNDNKKSLEPQKKNNDTDSNETLSNRHTIKSHKIASKIHWPSLGIGAGITFACIFCVILITNTINSETTQVLDEITISEVDTTKKITLSSFTDNASPILGNRNAQITLVEFGDYQCTFCSKFFHETEKSIITNYVKTGKVKLLFKDFIVVGDDSFNAANAAHCANDQNVFWQYHAMLYDNWSGEGTGWANLENLYEFANRLGLDMDMFTDCMSQSKWKGLVRASHIDGITVGVTATPTFFVIDQKNDVIKITGAQPYDVFKQIFDSVLKE